MATSNTDITLDVMRAARVYIETPEKWIQGALATAPDNPLTQEKTFSVNPRSAIATCWCFEGAIKRALHEYQRDEPDRWGYYALHADDRSFLQEDIFRMFSEKARALKLPCLGDPDEARPADYNDHPDATHTSILGCLDVCIAEVAEHVEGDE